MCKMWSCLVCFVVLVTVRRRKWMATSQLVSMAMVSSQVRWGLDEMRSSSPKLKTQWVSECCLRPFWKQSKPKPFSCRLSHGKEIRISFDFTVELLLWSLLVGCQFSFLSRYCYRLKRAWTCINLDDFVQIRHRASTSMYSLTFCVNFLLPERHQRKPAVQAATVMLRTPPVDGQSPASQPRW